MLHRGRLEKFDRYVFQKSRIEKDDTISIFRDSKFLTQQPDSPLKNKNRKEKTKIVQFNTVKETECKRSSKNAVSEIRKIFPNFTYQNL